DVQMIGDAGAGGAAEVDADVDPLRLVRLVEDHLGAPRQLHQLGELVPAHRRQTPPVAGGDDPPGGGVGRVEMQDDERQPATGDDQVAASGVEDATEDAVGRLAARGGHVGESPGGPEAFHEGTRGLGAESLGPPVPSCHYTASASGGTDPVADGLTGGAGSLLISSLSSFPGLKYGTFFGGTSTLSPVFGLRPFRGSRFRRRKLPKPRSSIFSPRCSASMMLRNTVSTITSECFFVRSDTRETSSTSSALVMLPLVMVPFSWGSGLA